MMAQKPKFWKPDDPSPQQKVLQERQLESFDSSVLYNASNADLSLQNQRQRLPIFNYRNHILFLLENNRSLVIVGETGCGKSTQIPQYLLETGWITPNNQKMAITQPRRIAAVSLASRVADERKTTLGEEVGYAIRFDDCCNEKSTLIKYMTDGVLLREMMTDPLLQQYSVIMIDEAHERSLNTDMCIGLLKKIQKRRPELRLIVSSATIDAKKFHEFFNVKDEQGNDTCTILSVEGRVYPVEVFYSKDPVPDYVAATVKTIMDIHLSPKEGDILAFLTGQEEVDRAVSMVQEQSRAAAKGGMKKYALTLPMYSTLPINEQQRIFEKTSRNCRKVVIATNIAETSITINGIVFVIDCGFVKIRAYNPHTGIDSLIVCQTSKASAQQRAGRAGRNRFGEAYRLYTEDEYEKLKDVTVPEMQRSSLIPVLLQLKSLGVENVVRFDFLSPPPAQCMANGMETLFALGAIDLDGNLVQPLGFQMSEFPLDPLFAKMILNSETFGCSEEIISIVAMLQVNTVFTMSARTRAASMKQHRKFAVYEGDHITLLNVYNAFVTIGNETKRWSNSYCLNFERLKRACQLRKQLEKYLNRFEIKLVSCGRDTEQIIRCITSGFFANAAKLQMDGTYHSLKGNNTLQIHPTSILATEKPPKFVIFNEILQTTNYYMRDISVINPDWLCELAPHYYETGTQRSIEARRTGPFQLVEIILYAMHEEQYDSDIDKIFCNKFDFELPWKDSHKTWTLPDIGVQKSVELHNVGLQSLKHQLNKVKASLNNHDITQWHRHTCNTNPASYVIRDIRSHFHPELCTQAWCKFHEILCFDEVIPEHVISSYCLKAVHICEAPGAFICSLNHHLKSRYPKMKYKWIGCTLNPYYEGNDPESCIADDRLIFHTIRQWCFGADNTGDVFLKSTLDELCNMASKLGNIDLVTADGSFNCQGKPENQEADTARLKYTELLYALNILGPGGSFVLKMFTMFENSSISLQYVLCCVFDSVTVRKPATSKPGNSEMYIIARGFHGIDKCKHLTEALMKAFPFAEPSDLELFSFGTIPEDFISQHKKCMEQFVFLQIRAIEKNKEFFASKTFGPKFEEHKEKISQFAIEAMEIIRIPRNQCILRSGILKGSTHSHVNLRPMLVGTYFERNNPKKKHIDEGEHIDSRHSNWLPWKSFSHPASLRSYDLIFGKPLLSIKLSLFCDTDKLMKLHESWRSPLTDADANSPSKHTDCAITTLLSELTAVAGKAYELEVVKSVLCWRQILSTIGCKLPVNQIRFVKRGSKENLSDCSILFVNIIKDQYDHGCFRELSSGKDLMEVAKFILGRLPREACTVILLPSALTRLAAGLLWIVCQCFEQYSLVPNVNRKMVMPGILLMCKGFRESGNWASFLDMAIHSSVETGIDQELLEIVHPHCILQEPEFLRFLKTCNHSVLSARLAMMQEFVI